MNLFKFINANEIQPYNGGFVVLDNRIYTNPTEEIIRKAGYKELVEVERPTFDPEKEYLSLTYQDGEKITEVWEARNNQTLQESTN